jgi:beta-glucanase (GH16 family)
MKYILTLISVLTLSIAHGQEIDLTKFKLTFSDEFDGDKLDTTKWQAPEMPRQGSCRWVKSLATVSDGALHLGIRLSDDPVLRYDCAAVRTRKDYDPKQTMFAQRYGYFEARAKLPKNMRSDYWAAFWMMCGNVNNSDTREGIEADILESFQQSNVPRYGMNFHWGGYGAKHNATGIKLAPTPELADGEFHRFGMYWDEKYYVAFFDGREIGRTELQGLGSKENGKTPSQGPCQKPGYLKLSCEAAAWAGATNQWEKDPTKEDEFVVDYVRAYEGTLPAPPTVSTAPLPETYSSHRIGVEGTRFTLDEKPFAYTGLSFFNAIFNPTFNASSEARLAWLKKFQACGINVLRVWCQWDNARGFIDASPTSTMFDPDGSLNPKHLATLKAILADATQLGICLEIDLFAQESYGENIRLGSPADERAVTALTRELASYRNATFQIWNEHSDAHVLPLLKVIKAIDPQRLVTNSPGYSGDLGTDEENAALDYLTPHTTRDGRYWEIAARELATLLKEFNKPVVDDEPARNGTAKFGGPKESTSPFDHVLQIHNVWGAGAFPTYHHDMFQTGYGSSSCPPSGIPDPEFNTYHKTVFDFLARRERLSPGGSH